MEGTTAQFVGSAGDAFSAICFLQKSRFTSSKPSISAIASDKKCIRHRTNSFVRYCLNTFVIRCCDRGWGAHGRGSGCCLREFRASADARVPFPQGKGTKGCRGPARIPCGAPAPGPPSDKYLVSVEPRRGAPDGVPSGSALTAPLKTFRFQRGPVLEGGKVRRG